jgi:hypothetical protein
VALVALVVQTRPAVELVELHKILILVTLADLAVTVVPNPLLVVQVDLEQTVEIMWHI